MTGTAAMDIGGQTTSKEFGLRRTRTYANHDEINSFKDTRLCVVDEISFATYGHDLHKLSRHMKGFTECNEWYYGSVAIVFLGDFCQLEPINGDCIYDAQGGLWEGELNCLVELHGTWRFKDCPEMMHIMPTWRNEGLSEEDRKILNSRVIDGVKVKMPDVLSTQFAAYYNAKRAIVNTEIFKMYLKRYHGNATKHNIPKTAIVIKANARWGKSKLPLSFGQRKVLFEQCTEADVQNGNREHCDPLLCLYSGCPLMFDAHWKC